MSVDPEKEFHEISANTIVIRSLNWVAPMSRKKEKEKKLGSSYMYLLILSTNGTYEGQVHHSHKKDFIFLCKCFWFCTSFLIPGMFFISQENPDLWKWLSTISLFFSVFVNLCFLFVPWGKTASDLSNSCSNTCFVPSKQRSQKT